MNIEEDPRSSKQLLLTVLEKCKEALPEIAIVMKRLDQIALQSSNIKIRKKDCLNPQFLMQLSECGQQIKGILMQALQQQALSKQALAYHYKQYMQVIGSIRKYHEKAHLSHDIHQNSTTMKENLLNELKAETIKRKELEKEIKYLRKEIGKKDERIAQLQALENKDALINISEISQISKKQPKYGQLYGGQAKVGIIEEDEQSIEGKRLRKRILELEEELEVKEQQLQTKQEQYFKTVEELKGQVSEVEKRFQQYYSSLQPSKTDTFKQFKATNASSREGSLWQQDEIIRLLFVQASTIEEYLNEKGQ